MINLCSFIDPRADLKLVEPYIFRVSKSKCRNVTGIYQCVAKGPLMMIEPSGAAGSNIPTLLQNKAKLTMVGNSATKLERGWYLLGTDQRLGRKTKFVIGEDWYTSELLPGYLQKAYDRFYKKEKRERQEARKNKMATKLLHHLRNQSLD